MINKRKQKLWCVVYRLGTPEQFSWHRTPPTNSWMQAKLTADTYPAGNAAMVVDYHLSISIGLPDTFSYDRMQTV